MLCKNCIYRAEVVSTEVGTVIDECRQLEVDIRTLGNVKTCSLYTARDLPYLFVREAWIMEKDKKGKWIFTRQRDNQ